MGDKLEIATETREISVHMQHFKHFLSKTQRHSAANCSWSVEMVIIIFLPLLFSLLGVPSTMGGLNTSQYSRGSIHMVAVRSGSCPGGWEGEKTINYSSNID